MDGKGRPPEEVAFQQREGVMRPPEEDWSSRGKGRTRDLGTEHAAFPGSRDREGERGGRGLGSSGRGRVRGALGW